ncbi:MFS transporter [Flexistipes sinusarabici]|uniref:MFS transporter n=1 Tax=Flexistipes sinusarabici TaxID=2352 RepID=UPI002357B647|nr:MFS transporter [Flexistipes sinusarabici]
MNTSKTGIQAVFFSLFYFLNFASLGVFLPYLALFFKENGFSGLQIGIVLALVPLCKFVFTSKWTKLFGASPMPHLFAASSVLLANIALYFLILFPGFFTAAVIVFVFSTLRVGLLPAVDHCSMEFFKKSGIEYGKMRMFGSIGFIASTVIMGKIVDIWGVDSIVIAASVLGCISAVPLIFLQLSDSVGKNDREKGSEAFPLFFYFILVAVIFYFASFKFFGSFFNIKIDEAGYSQFHAGAIWGFGILCEVFVMYYAGSIFRKYKAVNVLILSMFLGAFRLFVIAFSANLLILYTVNLLHGFAFGAYHLSVLRLIQQKLPEKVRLKAQSRYSEMSFGLGAIIGSVLSGIIYDMAGVNAIFTIGGLLAVFSSIIVFIGGKKLATSK